MRIASTPQPESCLSSELIPHIRTNLSYHMAHLTTWLPIISTLATSGILHAVLASVAGHLLRPSQTHQLCRSLNLLIANAGRSQVVA